MKTHGKSRTKTYKSWEAMKNRCSNIRSPYYPRYGGRGIIVCDRWLSYLNFLEDMGERPEGTTLDRIDNDGNYEPDNCRWIALSAQQNNRKDTRKFTINGVTKTFLEWRQESTIKPSTITQRYYVYGWSIERALGME